MDYKIITDVPAPVVTREETYNEKLSSIPVIAKLGPLFKSTPSIQLTENETEYTVSCIKHCYTAHIVLQVTSRSINIMKN